MPNSKKEPAYLHAKLGYKPLNHMWAKLEILLGLAAAGAGLLLGDWTLAREMNDLGWLFAAAALALFMLGGYLALAGSRSHLYQSNNELTAYLAAEIHDLKHKGSSE
jgi:hypothetical protein